MAGTVRETHARTSPATAVLRALAAPVEGLQQAGPLQGSAPARVGVLGMLASSGSGQRCRSRDGIWSSEPQVRP